MLDVGKGGCASAGGGGGGGWGWGWGWRGGGWCGGVIPRHQVCTFRARGCAECGGVARRGGAAGGWSRRRAGTLIIRKVGHTDAGPTLAPEKRCQICAFSPPPRTNSSPPAHAVSAPLLLLPPRHTSRPCPQKTDKIINKKKIQAKKKEKKESQ